MEQPERLPGTPDGAPVPQMGQAELAMIDQLVNKHSRAPPIPYLVLWSRDSFKECATACPLTPTGGTR